MKHIGIVACSVEGAALCYQAIGREAAHARRQERPPARRLCLFLLLQLVLRACGRVPGLGAAVFFAIAFGLTFANMRAMGVAGPLVVLIGVTSGVAWAFLILRFGILAMIANLLMRALLLAVPSTIVLTGWIAPSAWCVLGISALLTVYGLYYATAGRPFGRSETARALTQPAWREARSSRSATPSALAHSAR